MNTLVKEIRVLARICVALSAVSYCLLVLLVSHVRADDDALRKLESQYTAIEKTISSPVAGAQEFQAARARLQSLDRIAQKLIEQSGGEEDSAGAAIKLHARILDSLRIVQDRLPDPPRQPAAHLRTGFAVPEFTGQELLQKHSHALLQAHLALAEQLRRSPKGGAEVDESLYKMILAEEALAWEAGWPFTASETAAFRKANGLTPEVYACRLARGIHRVQEQAAFSHRSVGRDASHAFAVHMPADKVGQTQVTKLLVKQRGDAARAWIKLAKPFDARERKALLQ